MGDPVAHSACADYTDFANVHCEVLRLLNKRMSLAEQRGSPWELAAHRHIVHQNGVAGLQQAFVKDHLTINAHGRGRLEYTDKVFSAPLLDRRGNPGRKPAQEPDLRAHTATDHCRLTEHVFG